MAFAMYGMAVVLAPAIGPTLGGWITDQYSWRWIFYVNVPIGILSLFLINFMVKDPPHMEKAKRDARRNPVDFVGLVMVGTGLGALQVVLDKGQRDDWFNSTFIVWVTILAIVALLTFVIWEWNHKHPIVQLHLFRNSSFAVACVLMLVIFAALFGATVLIPQFAQTQLGYTAQKAGELLSPGGFVLMLIMPLAGVLVKRVDARYLIGFGLLAAAFAQFSLTHLYLGIDFKSLVVWRIYQASAMAFIFVPINVIAFTDMPPEASNQVSALTNLMRNMGGSIGISAVTTIVARRQQVHQLYLSRNTFQYNPHLQQLVTQLTTHLSARTNATAATRQAYGQVYENIQRQAAALAYIDAFLVMGTLCAAAIPILFFAKKVKPGQAAVGH
jgi:DHA2 family multidrug resistance protein